MSAEGALTLARQIIANVPGANQKPRRRLDAQKHFRGYAPLKCLRWRVVEA